jgi:hypothetical protein
LHSLHQVGVLLFGYQTGLTVTADDVDSVPLEKALHATQPIAPVVAQPIGDFIQRQ